MNATGRFSLTRMTKTIRRRKTKLMRMSRCQRSRRIEMKDIVTVIIKDDNDEYSTVSFLNRSDAIQYCLDEICSPYDEFDVDEVESIHQELEYQHMYEDPYDGDTYYIEEAKLCKSYESDMA
jgi:hypothetical protein